MLADIFIGTVKVPVYGLFLGLAFLWGLFFAWKLTRLTSNQEEDVFDAIFVALFWGAITSRLFFVVLHWGEFGFDFLKLILINGYPGFNLVGFLLGFYVSIRIFLAKKRMKIREVLDHLAPSLLLTLALGKLGAFFSGSEVGAKTTFQVALKYANYEGMRHLTPLYESVLLFLAFAVAYRLLFEIRRYKFPKGYCFGFAIWSISIVYISMDIIKSDRIFIQGISFNLIAFSIILLTTTLVMLYHGKKFFFSSD